MCRFSTLSDGWPACWTASRCSRRAVRRSMCQHYTDSSVTTIKCPDYSHSSAAFSCHSRLAKTHTETALAAYRSSSSPLVLRCRQKNGLRLHVLRVRINIHFTLSQYLSFSQIPQSPDSMLLQVSTSVGGGTYREVKRRSE